MPEALAAEGRALKAAARPARGQDESIIGISATSHSLLSSGRSLWSTPENDGRPLPLSEPALLPMHEQKLQQPASSGKSSGGLQIGAPEIMKRSARRK
jgi:hypothetical protein